MAAWFNHLGVTREVVVTSIRTTAASTLSFLVARLLRQPEFYWAPISTIVILLSPIDPLSVAWQRFAGTALGALLGALIASCLQQNWTAFMWLIYGAGILLCGMLCAVLRLAVAYRFAAITLTIVLLVPHDNSPWVVASHRFVEVSLGIAVALMVTVVWPLPQSAAQSTRTRAN
jgi:uncharacterized membrane protein YgaE (UPF0421/DUF939 family)